MEGCPLQEVGVSWGSSMAVRKHRAWLLACSMRASARHSIALYSSSQHTQAEGTGHPRSRQALCLSGCVTRPRRFFGNSSTGCTVSIFSFLCFYESVRLDPRRAVRVLSPRAKLFSRRVGPRDG